MLERVRAYAHTYMFVIALIPSEANAVLFQIAEIDLRLFGGICAQTLVVFYFPLAVRKKKLNKPLLYRGKVGGPFS